MFGDIVLYIKEKWKQFWCIHDYKYRDLPADCSHFYCTKCGKIKKEECPIDTYEGRIKLFYFERFLSFLDTLEVKEVNIDKEIEEEYLKRRCYGGRDNMLVILNEPQFNKIAKHFFELGLNARKEG